jgi:hypothetical protein
VKPKALEVFLATARAPGFREWGNQDRGDEVVIADLSAGWQSQQLLDVAVPQSYEWQADGLFVLGVSVVLGFVCM